MRRTAISNPTSPICTEDIAATVHHLCDWHSPSNITSHCEYVMRPDQLPSVVEQLRRSGNDGSWAVFMFRTAIPSEDTTDEYLNLQYSVESGIIGFDWVLLGERNRADKRVLTRFMRRLGHTVIERRMNEVVYLRVEDADITKLGMSIISDFYSLAPDYPMGLLVRGFLPPSSLGGTASQ